MTESLASQPAPVAERFGAGLAIAAMTARLLVPTESTIQGETLWIVVLLLVAATIYSIGRWQAGHRLRFDGFTLAVGLIIVGHLVSGVWILSTEGHKRWAVNVMWEWIGLGATCFVLRRNKSALYVIAAMVVVLAGQGVWQYFVDFPALRAEYAAHISDDSSALDQVRLQNDLTMRGIPESEAGRKLFADRLRSLEPLGPFALTNTLAGLLAVGLLLGLISHLRDTRSLGQYLVGAIVLIPIAYCLFLTKSRTAIVAVTVGVILYGVRRLTARRRAESKASRNGPVVVAGLMAIVAATLVAAVASGGLDEEVISESSKSLRYRLMYWQGTIDALRESPVLGTGPGNFRQSYTPHKLAASSEEILDPHNMFLDAWCNGGAISLIGLLLLAGFVTRACLFGTPAAGDPPPPSAARPSGLAAGCSGFALVFAQQWLTGQERVLLSLGLATGFVVAWFAVVYAFQKLKPDSIRIATALAAAGLMVHLLGAGGFGMPAVAQVLLLLVAAGFPTNSVQKERKWTGLVPVPIGVLAVVACLLTAAIPVTHATFLIQRGDSRTGDAALKDYGDADKIDTLSPKPARRFARALISRGEHLGIALASLTRARRRDPKSHSDHFSIGMTLKQGRPPSDESPELEAAVRHLETAAARYPTNPEIVGNLAIAHELRKQSAEAAEQARRALQLDEINRKNGHADRFLPADFVNQLNSIIERTNKEQPPRSSGTPQ